MAILRVRDDKGNIIDIPAIKGDKGEKGEQGPQGVQGEKGDKGDKGNSSAFKKIAAITTAEEVNSIFATAEEFPDISKCKEFIVRVVFPKTDTALTLGAMRIVINNSNYVFRSNTVTTSTSGLSETRCHTVLADGLIHTVGTENNRAHSAMVGNAVIFVGDISFSNTLQEVSAILNDNTKRFPVGTRFEIYGKVEE